ncbi:MAG: polyprenyl synthetase family protein [Clostridia bacterium]|nr:polyprenyl synthetase family protein [Clostridia bacterium]
MNFHTKYELFRAYFERALGIVFERETEGAPEMLAESMRYSLEAGGKRVRPVLFLATLDTFGYAWEEEIALATAIECIHTYSLIHDDLPAMDNDDLRRGKPSNHKMFGEANAILAGDGLLSLGFHLLLKEATRSKRHLAAGEILSRAAGVLGMVAGQSFELFCEKQPEKFSEEELLAIYRRKTSDMIAAPCAMAATLANCFKEEFLHFGEKLGMLFQLTDDILDAKSGEDCDKLTATQIYGIEGAEKMADAWAEDCKNILKKIGADTTFHEYLVDFVRNRKH